MSLLVVLSNVFLPVLLAFVNVVPVLTNVMFLPVLLANAVFLAVLLVNIMCPVLRWCNGFLDRKYRLTLYGLNATTLPLKLDKTQQQNNCDKLQKYKYSLLVEMRISIPLTQKSKSGAKTNNWRGVWIQPPQSTFKNHQDRQTMETNEWLNKSTDRLMDGEMGG